MGGEGTQPERLEDLLGDLDLKCTIGVGFRRERYADGVADPLAEQRAEAGWVSALLQVLIDAAEDVAHLTDDALVATVCADLARFFPACRGRTPTDVTVLRLKGTYCGTRTGYWSLVPRTPETGVDGVWLAGDYTAGVYHYGMESAVISGKAVANRLLALRGFPPHSILRPRYLPFVAA